MQHIGPTVLISGAAPRPVLAYWLHRHGCTPIVVERTPERRVGDGGHAVALLGPTVDVVDRMNLLDTVRAARTRTEVVTLARPGK